MTAVEACNSLGALVVLPLVALPEFFVLDRQGAARHFQNWERSVWNGRTSSL
jgi:hypothetical protein